MCIVVWPVCISVSYVCLVPTETKRGHLISWNCSYRHLLTTVVLGMEPGSSARVVLTTEPSFQPLLPLLTQTACFGIV